MDAEADKSLFITEIPETLRKLVLFLVKTFYGLENFVIADYIQRKTILKEEALRDLLKIDLKYLRQLVLPLKIDKFIKEKLVSEEVDGRAKKINYFFINYKAILNVTKYKLDHMRQKLESREKDDVHRTQYKCTYTSCNKHYEDIDIGKIFNPLTDEMRCWQCGHIVETDESAGPSSETRNSLALFNEQMARIYTILQNFDGVRFSQEIIEPPIPITDTSKEEQQTPQRVLRVGERAFSTSGKTRSELYGSGITVSIGDEVVQQPTAKEAVPWLQNHQQPADSTQSVLLNDTNLMSNSFDGMLGTSKTLTSTASAPNIATIVSSNSNELPAVKRAKREDIVSLLLEEEGHSLDATSTNKNSTTNSANKINDFSTLNSISNGSKIENNGNSDQDFNLENGAASINEDDDEEEDEVYVMVQGKRIHIDNITDEIVAQMTPEEKETYIKSVQNNFDYYY